MAPISGHDSAGDGSQENSIDLENEEERYLNTGGSG